MSGVWYALPFLWDRFMAEGSKGLVHEHWLVLVCGKPSQRSILNRSNLDQVLDAFAFRSFSVYQFFSARSGGMWLLPIFFTGIVVLGGFTLQRDRLVERPLRLPGLGLTPSTSNRGYTCTSRLGGYWQSVGRESLAAVAAGFPIELWALHHITLEAKWYFEVLVRTLFWAGSVFSLS